MQIQFGLISTVCGRRLLLTKANVSVSTPSLHTFSACPPLPFFSSAAHRSATATSAAIFIKFSLTFRRVRQKVFPQKFSPSNNFPVVFLHFGFCFLVKISLAVWATFHRTPLHRAQWSNGPVSVRSAHCLHISRNFSFGLRVLSKFVVYSFFRPTSNQPKNHSGTKLIEISCRAIYSYYRKFHVCLSINLSL